jgi:protein-tyrosine phosphatase
VRWGQLYRSGELPRLTDPDVARLADLGVKTVVTFLTEEEIRDRGKDRLPDGVRVVNAPISGEGLAEAAHEARTTGDFTKLPPTINPEIHRLLVEEAKREYADFIRTAADPANRPLVFHCSHGVHRTGTAAAMLLSALGVDWDTVRADYLLSNVYRKNEVEERIAKLTAMTAESQGIPVDQVDATNIEAFYRLQGAYIDATLAEIEKRYGSMDAYLRDGLGLDEEVLSRLRRTMLD